MSRVLWITPYPPAFAGGGGHIRQAHLLDALAAEHEVTVVTAGVVRDERVRALAATVVEVPVEARDRGDLGPLSRRVRDLAAAVAARRPREVADQAPVARALARAAAPHVPDADVAVLEYAGLGPLTTSLGLPTVLTLHNLPSRMAGHLAAISSGRRRWVHERDERISLAYERRVAEASTRAVVVSGQDAATLDRPCVVIPNGVDIDVLTPTPLARGAGIVFVGALDTGPNRDGARWLAEAVLPLVRARRSDAHLEIVGSRPSADVVALGSLEGVTVRPDVPDVRPYLEAARVAAVAIRIGSGTRLKALEAMALGRPVVGTSIGLEGLAVEPEVHALVADDAVTFAAALVELIEDGPRAEALAGAGRTLVEDRFGWTAIGASFSALVREAATGAHDHSSSSGP
ncbi:MAG: glycosyltransferase [Acidimicrobiales bacterium]